jgi:hypothetical protein
VTGGADFNGIAIFLPMDARKQEFLAGCSPREHCRAERASCVSFEHMIPDDDQIRSLIARPGESLNVEIKRWLDPADTAGAAKIVKAVFAVRNRNGGFLVIGFDDKTLLPDISGEPVDVRGAFHQDTIQGLVSRYA